MTEVSEEQEASQEKRDASEEEPEDSGRGLVPEPEEAEERWFRWLVRILDDEEVKEEYPGDEEVVEDAENRLMEHFQTTFRHYIKYRIVPIMIVAFIIGTVIPFIIGTVIYPYIRPVPLQTYGLLANLLGAIILAVNTTRGRFMIANLSLSEEEQSRAFRESLARQTAITTAGLGAFIVGFLIQLLAVLLSA